MATVQLGERVVDFVWPDFLAEVITSKGLLYQHVEDADQYVVFAFDGPVAYRCTLYKTSISGSVCYPAGYTSAQNDTDFATWEATYKAGSNKTLEQRAADGRVVVRNTTANHTKNFNLKVFSFQPGDSSAIENLDGDFNPIGDITITCYKADGTVTTDPTLAVKTVLDWEPAYNYDVIGGWVDVPASIVGTTPGVWYVTVIGVPDVPRAYGGSVPFVYPCDIALVTTMKVVSDGRATQYMIYNPTYHTNKLRWIFKHPASATNPRFQIYVEMFT